MRGSDTLEARLEAAVGDAAGTRTVVALVRDGERRIAAAGSRVDRPEDEPVRTGCVTKLLVAALVERKLETFGLDRESEVLSWFRAARPEPLAGVTLRHLLEHTHGMDDGHIAAAPRDEGGRIDAERLLELLGGTRLAPPGELYSYSNIGAWLLAARLEALEGRPFAALLQDELFAPLGIGSRRERRAIGPAPPLAADICPAMGGRLVLTVGDLLEFLEASAPGLGADEITPLPGWHPLERGIHLGWKCYDDGWLGHQSILPGASLLVRVRPRDGNAVVVASAGHHAAVVAARVLGAEMPRLFAVAIPRPSARATAGLEPIRYCGRYASTAECLDVEAAGGALILKSPSGATRLVRCGGELFMLESTAAARSFVEFIGRDGACFRRLWDGRRIYPLVASPVIT